jgi:SAM-dependent methyltransferase
MPTMSRADIDRKTIADFGEQWTAYRDNAGRYGSTEYFFDIVAPALTADDIRGATIADIGSGTGRIVLMLLDAGAKFVHAVEPSEAFDVLRRNTADFSGRIAHHNVRGEDLPPGLDLDLVVSIGVIHHIPDPAPTMRGAYRALRSGGRCVIWLYGHEGNEAYLAIIRPIRWLTTRLPHVMLAALCHALNGMASGYALAARGLPLPLAGYMRNVFSKMDRRTRYLVIYDQLNPAYAKYYRRDEAVALLADAGFVEVAANHRHGYSWTVSGRKP